MSSTRSATSPGVWTALIALVALAYCVALASVPPTPAPPPDDGGREVFISKGCAGCHAIYGHGVGGAEGSGGPDLGERKVYGTHLELAAKLWNHLPKMLKQMNDQGIPSPEFNTEEVDQVVQYLSLIRYLDQPGNPRSGRRLLDRKRCSRCHGFESDEGKVGPALAERDSYVSPLDLATALWNHGPDMQAVFDEQGIDRPNLGRYDIVDLAAGIRSYIVTNTVPPEAYEPGNPGVGRELIQSKGCTQCHSIRGSGGDLAPDFISLDLRKTVTEIAGEMWNHGPEMWEIMLDRGMSFPRLNRTEMADLISYLYSLGLDDEPGDSRKGEKLVSKKRCNSCHSIDGVGGDMAGDLLDAGQFESPTSMVAAMWNHAADMADAGRERNVRWPSLSGDDLADIYSFITTGSR